ncbi:MAG: radical SAM protein [Candidatus Nealsonbacteria bacterium]
MENNRKNRVLLVCPSMPGMLVLPLAAGLFTAVLKKDGFEVDLFDATLYESEESAPAQKRVELLQVRKFSYKDELGVELKSDLIGSFKAKVSSFKPDLLVFSILEDTIKQTLALLDSIKEKNIPHIVGGVFATAAPEKAIAYPQIKMIGLGEGENVVLQLAQKIREGFPFDDLPNAWIKDFSGKIIKNSIGPLVDIENIIPDYGLFEKSRFYRPVGGRIFKTIPLETARGCPFQCTFCNSPMWSRFYHEMRQAVFLRRKSVSNLIKEIKYLAEEYDPELFWIVDDTFLARPIEEIRAFAEKYQEIRIPFWMNTRPETITQEKMDLLKKMNCYRLSLGIECGNEEFRKNKLKRYAPNKEILERMALVEKSGIPFSVNNIIGFPDETRSLIFETIELNRKLSGYDTMTVNIFAPYHGSQLREEAIQKGYLDPEASTINTTSSSILRMPQLSVEEIDGLVRVFMMYVRFPEKWRSYIEKAEKLTEEGNLIFSKLSKIYSDIFLKGDQFTKLQAEPDWDKLKSTILN